MTREDVIQTLTALVDEDLFREVSDDLEAYIRTDDLIPQPRQLRALPAVLDELEHELPDDLGLLLDSCFEEITQRISAEQLMPLIVASSDAFPIATDDIDESAVYVAPDSSDDLPIVLGPEDVEEEHEDRFELETRLVCHVRGCDALVADKDLSLFCREHNAEMLRDRWDQRWPKPGYRPRKLAPSRPSRPAR